MSMRCFACALALSLCAASLATAQPLAPPPAEAAPADSNAPPADVQAPASPSAEPAVSSGSEPPKALVVPEVAWPAALETPESGALEAELLIGKDGRAQLERCEQPPLVCDAIEAALLEAEFAPARIAGEPRAARVRVRFAVRAQPAAREPVPAPEAPASDAATPVAPEQAAATPEFGAVGRVQVARPTAHALELEEMREVPGAFGDPFRVIDALPGVVPVMTGLPYVYVRGAPPAATAYFYDDIHLPALFHLGLGPAVVHPAMVGPIDFYPGVAPARYGRRTGGVVAGQAANRPLRDGVHGELELRLVDMQAYIAAPIGERGRVEVGGRYGYPGLVTKLFEPSAVLQYWDYQVRTLFPLTRDTDVAIIALGSFDLVGERTDRGFERGIELQFHRLEVRSITRLPRVDITYALGFGFERSGFDVDFDVTALRVGPKVWLDTRIRRARVRIGADMLATSGEISDPRDEDEFDESDGNEAPVQEDPIYRSAVGRNVLGLYTEVNLPLAPRWDLEAGLRGDLWITGGHTQQALEPRLLLRHQVHELVGLHAAFGLAYQPAVFPIPLPSVSDVALDRGLQRAIQNEIGSAVDLPSSFRAETKLFVHLYDDMLSLEALEEDDVSCDDEGCEEEEGFGRMTAYAYGAELLVRRSYQERFSGWLAYTLSKADGHTDGGRPLTPNFDVRHVGNLVLQWRISRGFHAAMRGYVQSGRFPLGAGSVSDTRENQRLPLFFRGDLQVSRIWPRPWGELRFSFEWLNFTFQREPVSWSCPGERNARCKVQYVVFPITVPMLGVRGSY